MKLLNIIAGAILTTFPLQMPDLNNYKLVQDANIYCFSENQPDVTLRWYESGDERAFSASRYNKTHPFAIILKEGYVYYDDGSNG